MAERRARERNNGKSEGRVVRGRTEREKRVGERPKAINHNKPRYIGRCNALLSACPLELNRAKCSNNSLPFRPPPRLSARSLFLFVYPAFFLFLDSLHIRFLPQFPTGISPLSTAPVFPTLGTHPYSVHAQPRLGAKTRDKKYVQLNVGAGNTRRQRATS